MNVLSLLYVFVFHYIIDITICILFSRLSVVIHNLKLHIDFILSLYLYQVRKVAITISTYFGPIFAPNQTDWYLFICFNQQPKKDVCNFNYLELNLYSSWLQRFRLNSLGLLCLWQCINLLFVINILTLKQLSYHTL